MVYPFSHLRGGQGRLLIDKGFAIWGTKISKDGGDNI